MRAAVIILNALSIVAALAVTPMAFYVGGWELLGLAYGGSQDTVLGILIITAPIITTGLCVLFSVRYVRRNRIYAPFIAGLPLLVAVVALINSPLAFGPRP